MTTPFEYPPVNAPGLLEYIQRRGPVGILSGTNDTGGVHSGATNHDAAAGTYDFSVAANRSLTIYVSEDNGGTYTAMTIGGLVGATPAATSAAEVAALLTASIGFSKYLTAANAGGTLRLNALMPSSRFKMYFGGTAAAILGGVFTTAVAAGSAVTGANVAGKAMTFTAQDQLGNAVPNFPIHVSNLVGGTPSSTSAIGLVSKGTMEGALGQYDDCIINTDADGTIAFYLADSAAEAVVCTCRPGSNTSKIAVAMQGTQQITFS